ncbi:hypothetical protein BAZSYMB_GCONTIG00744_1 [Bathymodiolus azoricus thioautotrophic gill symbiont]|uniref:Uncharacterized protein n=1 Tax=Bathymodiolus azoricus thioautotrophic gill symbiont TaxID=235205 RepID=A0A1H6JW01_9GAMM|nr:hypothetical protein BAZSYMB_GCONTIG00744_1 [Bathymodiolus azoricus thioautotrophic gill symbiont]
MLIVQLKTDSLIFHLVVKTTNRGGLLRCKQLSWHHDQYIRLYPYASMNLALFHHLTPILDDLKL